MNFYFAILFLFLSFAGKIGYFIENYPQIRQIRPGFQIAQGGDNYDFSGDGRPKPGSRRGGASRGNCPPTQPPLTALIPENNLGLTAKEHPNLWFYIPYNSREINRGELMLLDENQRPALEKPISVEFSRTPGIIGVTLPSTGQPLELEREYRWFFELVCDPDNPSNNPRVDGWIKRVQPSQELNSQLENNQTEQRYRVYAENGIWYDALTAIIQKMCVDGSNLTLTSDWSDLLESVDLLELVGTSLTDCS